MNESFFWASIFAFAVAWMAVLAAHVAGVEDARQGKGYRNRFAGLRAIAYNVGYDSRAKRLKRIEKRVERNRARRNRKTGNN